MAAWASRRADTAAAAWEEGAGAESAAAAAAARWMAAARSVSGGAGCGGRSSSIASLGNGAEELRWRWRGETAGAKNPRRVSAVPWEPVGNRWKLPEVSEMENGTSTCL